MSKNSPFYFVIIFVVTALAVWYIFPSILFYSKPLSVRQKIINENPDIRKKVINLGLDLQGGMRLVLEVDRSNLSEDESRDVLDRAYTVIENRINGLGIAEPSIQKQGNDRLIVELPGLQDEKAAKQILGSTAQLEFKLQREPAEYEKAIRTIDRVLRGELITNEKSDTASAEEEEAQEQAEQLFSGKESAKDQSSENSEKSDLSVPESKVLIEKSFSEYLVRLGSQVGVLEKERPKVESILERDDVQDALKKAGLGGSHFLWGNEVEQVEGREYRALYYLKAKPELKGDIIKDAYSDVARGGMDAGQSVVNLEMNRDGARKFSRVTGANVNKFLAIVLDSTVYSAPQIRQRISQGSAQITGNFSVDEAKGLAVVLRAGALPAPHNIIEERTVGPSLGQDSIQKALLAGIIGSLLVIAFMIVYYKLSGLVANLALILNLIFILAFMAALGATLTLPGVAGIILIMGMAIDANVIIFERIREELGIGKTIRSAVEAGYSRAFVTIMDANITTLFVAAILMWVGTGPIKGFAVTMILGITISLFTALFFTRVILNSITNSKNLRKLSI